MGYHTAYHLDLVLYTHLSESLLAPDPRTTVCALDKNSLEGEEWKEGVAKAREGGEASRAGVLVEALVDSEAKVVETRSSI